MFKNTFQSGFLSVLYSIGSKPLQIWDKKVRRRWGRGSSGTDRLSLPGQARGCAEPPARRGETRRGAAAHREAAGVARIPVGPLWAGCRGLSRPSQVTGNPLGRTGVFFGGECVIVKVSFFSAFAEQKSPARGEGRAGVRNAALQEVRKKMLNAGSRQQKTKRPFATYGGFPPVPDVTEMGVFCHIVTRFLNRLATGI